MIRSMSRRVPRRAEDREQRPARAQSSRPGTGRAYLRPIRDASAPRGSTFVAALCGVLLSAGVAQPSPAALPDAATVPWSAPTPPPKASELTFTSGEARLSGTLYLPASRGPRPVVVVYHSASDALRDATLYRHLIAMLPPLGIGVFVFDRRGSGRSSGPAPDGSFEVLADDGIAARRMLEGVAGVDRRRIGYWGLSQGGWLAALAARRDPDCAFSISISAPMVTADVQMLFATGNVLRIRGYGQEAIDTALDARRGVDNFMRGLTSREDAQKRLDRAAAQPWFDQIYMSRTFHDPSVSGWAREMRNDPLAVVTAIRKPTLILYGATDPWVPVATSLERLAPVVRSHRNLTLHVIAGADHAMMTSATPRSQVDPVATARQAPEAPEYFGVMIAWLARQGLLDAERR